MLAPCKACSQVTLGRIVYTSGRPPPCGAQVIEIAAFTEHLLSECQHQADYRQCPRCVFGVLRHDARCAARARLRGCHAGCRCAAYSDIHDRIREYMLTFARTCRCAEPIHIGDYTKHTKDAACVIAIDDHNKWVVGRGSGRSLNRHVAAARRCPLCHEVAGRGDEGWLQHLLEVGCPSNPRHRLK